MVPEKVIQSVLDANRFAILATQDDGQPHTSLMAFTPMDGIRYLIVATYRNTLKHCNIMKNNRVAILVENRKESGYATHRDLVLTAHGIASELRSGDHEAAAQAHLSRHSDLSEFLLSPDCVLLRIAVTAYEVVGGTDDVLWYKLPDIVDS